MRGVRTAVMRGMKTSLMRGEDRGYARRSLLLTMLSEWRVASSVLNKIYIFSLGGRFLTRDSF